ncbi:hypothetical protein Aperf_G00000127373 [Anoplocephala perfoliata]
MLLTFLLVFALQYPLYKAENNRATKCDVKHCRDAYADCFNFTKYACCVCPPGFYGGGGERCIVKSATDRFIRLKGMLSIELSNGTHEDVFPISHETIVIRGPPMGQTAIRDVPSMGIMHNTLHLLTPVFHFINSINSLPKANSRVYNIFSLTGGFSSLVHINFKLTYDNIGILVVDVSIHREVSDPDYYEGKLQVNVKSEGVFRVPKEVYSEKTLGERIVNYSKIARGVLQIERQQLHFVSKDYPPRTLRGSIVGTSYMAMDGSTCLLENRSLVEQGRDAFKVLLGPKGFCTTVRSQNSSSYILYCLDYPVLESKQTLYTEPEGVRKPRVIQAEEVEEEEEEENEGDMLTEEEVLAESEEENEDNKGEISTGSSKKKH